jgi:hypothetical protein
MSITLQLSAMPAVGVIPILCVQPSSQSRPAATASQLICAKIAGIFATTISRG